MHVHSIDRPASRPPDILCEPLALGRGEKLSIQRSKHFDILLIPAAVGFVNLHGEISFFPSLDSVSNAIHFCGIVLNVRANPLISTGQVLKNLVPLDKLSFLEQYAVFMGKAQIVELALKRILMKKYRYGKRRLEKMTLGAAIHELKEKGFNPQFIDILEELNGHRVAIAHEFLATEVFITKLIGRHGFSRKPLRNAHFAAELAIQYHDWLFKSGEWK